MKDLVENLLGAITSVAATWRGWIIIPIVTLVVLVARINLTEWAKKYALDTLWRLADDWLLVTIRKIRDRWPRLKPLWWAWLLLGFSSGLCSGIYLIQGTQWLTYPQPASVLPIPPAAPVSGVPNPTHPATPSLQGESARIRPPFKAHYSAKQKEQLLNGLQAIRDNFIETNNKINEKESRISSAIESMIHRHLNDSVIYDVTDKGLSESFASVQDLDDFVKSLNHAPSKRNALTETNYYDQELSYVLSDNDYRYDIVLLTNSVNELKKRVAQLKWVWDRTNKDNEVAGIFLPNLQEASGKLSEVTKSFGMWVDGVTHRADEIENGLP
jgi:polyhydroxyalkanoate synthesis regulator phasin